MRKIKNASKNGECDDDDWEWEWDEDWNDDDWEWEWEWDEDWNRKHCYIKFKIKYKK